jgi:hypothetical protein
MPVEIFCLEGARTLTFSPAFLYLSFLRPSLHRLQLRSSPISRTYLQLDNMSFGFSAGDFITALELVATVIDALRDTGRAATQYRGVLKQLHSLQTALVAVQTLDIDESLVEFQSDFCIVERKMFESCKSSCSS